MPCSSLADANDARWEMMMKPSHEPEGNTSQKPAADTTARKVYHRPVVRVLGAVHLMTRGAGETQNGDGGQMMRVGSDRAIKQNVVRIGDHPFGIGLYLFDYKPDYRTRCGFGRQFGVMADEVEAVMPEAVSTHPDGYKMVDYARLGITKPQ
jgi:hypothetical protein